MAGGVNMATWPADDLRRIANSDELRLASRRADGSLRGSVTMWVVRVGDDLYVRSAYGPDNPWFLRALASGTGRVSAGGVERDVSFTSADPGVQGEIDAAYHAKYDRYGQGIAGHVTGPDAHAVTIRLASADDKAGDTA
jgi:hypothetical protein